MTVLAADVDGLLLIRRERRCRRAHEIPFGVTVDAGHTGRVVTVSGSELDTSTICQLVRVRGGGGGFRQAGIIQ